MEAKKITDYTPPSERVFVLLPEDGPEAMTRPVVFGARSACGLFFGSEFEKKLVETTIVT